MTPIRQREQIARELAGLQSLLQETPDDPFAKPLLESRIKSLQDELLSEETFPFVPETELLFSGKAVFGSVGIDAKFAGHVLHSYQDMLNTHYAAKRHGNVGKQGRLPGEKESRLYLTGLPRGPSDLFWPNRTATTSFQLLKSMRLWSNLLRCLRQRHRVMIVLQRLSLIFIQVT
jgi:hypothetical protein